MDVEERFRELAEVWREETECHSAPDVIFGNPAYREIIALGPAVVPLILADLARTQSHWFWALREITGENPIRPEDRGNVPRMTERWLEWGRARSLV